MNKRSHIDTVASHAALGEQLIELVRASGLLRKKPGRKKGGKRRGRKPKATEPRVAKPRPSRRGGNKKRPIATDTQQPTGTDNN